MKRFQVIIPMAGSGERFRQAGYHCPKAMIDVAGQPAIERLLAKFPSEWLFIFIACEEDLDRNNLRQLLSRLAPTGKIVGIPRHQRGPVFSLAQAASAIDPLLPTIVNYCDFSFAWDPSHFVAWAGAGGWDGGILSYRGFHPHYLRQNPYAYCRMEGDQVAEVREKGHFTADRTQEYASSGTYYFASGAVLKQYVDRALRDGLSIGGEHYVSLVYNPMIQDGRRIGVYEIAFFLQWGTPEDLEDYVYWHRAFERFAAFRWQADSTGCQLVMPMAGQGSRFREGGLPKPLIPVLGEPMYRTARRFLPHSGNPPVFVIRTEIESTIRAADPDAKIAVVHGNTEGQADSTRLSVPLLDPEKPVLVSACDHGLIWNTTAWRELMQQQPDVVVIGQRGYPGARRTPGSFSYLKENAAGQLLAVSVKAPFTDRPHEELVLVGTFYFSRAKLLGSLLDQLIQKNRRVNGERYLDSILDLALEQGLDVRCFESESYLNWGSPDALAEFEYYQRYFMETKS